MVILRVVLALVVSVVVAILAVWSYAAVKVMIEMRRRRPRVRV